MTSERWLGERDARRFVLRKSGSVAVEQSGSHDLTWLAPENRHENWDAHASGHIDDRDQPASPNRMGVTYHVSTWKSDTGERLVLLPEMC